MPAAQPRCEEDVEDHDAGYASSSPPETVPADFSVDEVDEDDDSTAAAAAEAAQPAPNESGLNQQLAQQIERLRPQMEAQRKTDADVYRVAYEAIAEAAAVQSRRHIIVRARMRTSNKRNRPTARKAKQARANTQADASAAGQKAEEEAAPQRPTSDADTTLKDTSTPIDVSSDDTIVYERPIAYNRDSWYKTMTRNKRRRTKAQCNAERVSKHRPQTRAKRESVQETLSSDSADDSQKTQKLTEPTTIWGGSSSSNSNPVPTKARPTTQWGGSSSSSNPIPTVAAQPQQQQQHQQQRQQQQQQQPKQTQPARQQPWAIPTSGKAPPEPPWRPERRGDKRWKQ